MMEHQRTHVADKSAQPYDKRFSDAPPGSELDDGMMKVLSDFECDVCGRRTKWVHAHLAVYLCSRDCLTRYQAG